MSTTHIDVSLPTSVLDKTKSNQIITSIENKITCPNLSMKGTSTLGKFVMGKSNKKVMNKV